MRKKVKTVNVKQIQDLDKRAIEKYGVPSLALMENAGSRTAAEVLKLLKKRKKPSACVVCGLGNNAGDGFVIARHLINAGVATSVLLIGKGSRLKADAAVNYKILKKVGHPIQECVEGDVAVIRKIKQAHVVVDAIFGVGLNREVGGHFKSVIEAINTHSRKTVAVDVPSGLDGTTGKIYGTCIKADVTVTFTFIKKGFLKNEGPGHIGKAVAVDIGIPAQIL